MRLSRLLLIFLLSEAFPASSFSWGRRRTEQGSGDSGSGFEGFSPLCSQLTGVALCSDATNATCDNYFGSEGFVCACPSPSDPVEGCDRCEDGGRRCSFAGGESDSPSPLPPPSPLPLVSLLPPPFLSISPPSLLPPSSPPFASPPVLEPEPTVSDNLLVAILAGIGGLLCLVVLLLRLITPTNATSLSIVIDSVTEAIRAAEGEDSN